MELFKIMNISFNRMRKVSPPPKKNPNILLKNRIRDVRKECTCENSDQSLEKKIKKVSKLKIFQRSLLVSKHHEMLL